MCFSLNVLLLLLLLLGLFCVPVFDSGAACEVLTVVCVLCALLSAVLFGFYNTVATCIFVAGSYR